MAAKNCRTAGPLLKTVAAPINQAADEVVTADVGVLAHDGAFLFG